MGQPGHLGRQHAAQDGGERLLVGVVAPQRRRHGDAVVREHPVGDPFPGRQRPGGGVDQRADATRELPGHRPQQIDAQVGHRLTQVSQERVQCGQVEAGGDRGVPHGAGRKRPQDIRHLRGRPGQGGHGGGEDRQRAGATRLMQRGAEHGRAAHPGRQQHPDALARAGPPDRLVHGGRGRGRVPDRVTHRPGDGRAEHDRLARQQPADLGEERPVRVVAGPRLDEATDDPDVGLGRDAGVDERPRFGGDDPAVVEPGVVEGGPGAVASEDQLAALGIREDHGVRVLPAVDETGGAALKVAAVERGDGGDPIDDDRGHGVFGLLIRRVLARCGLAPVARGRVGRGDRVGLVGRGW